MARTPGHIICLDQTTTGDGIVAALQVLTAVCSAEMPLAKLRSGMSRVPQILVNVRFAEGKDPLAAEAVQQEVAKVEQELGGRGRVLLRKSGTEPLIRVMVEGSMSNRCVTWHNASPNRSNRRFNQQPWPFFNRHGCILFKRFENLKIALVS